MFKYVWQINQTMSIYVKKYKQQINFFVKQLWTFIFPAKHIL